MMKVPLSRPFLNDEIKSAVLKVLDSERYINGPEVKSFEREFADYLGVKHGIAVNSATSGLMLALKAMNVKPGDEIIVPSHTAFPSIEPIMHVGAVPVFVDIKEGEFNLDTARLRNCLSRKTKVIIPVHLYGCPVDMASVMQFATDNNLFVIEDCAQAHGAKWKGKKVGSFGDAAVFSFFPSKNLTVAGDGGMVVSNNDNVDRVTGMLRNHGRESRYEHEMVGYNLRLSEIQCAVGRVQLKNLDWFVKRRREVATRYNDGLKNVDLVLPKEPDDALHAYHLYVIMSGTRDKLKEKLSESGISTEIHYPIPCHGHPGTKNYFKEFGFNIAGGLDNTNRVVDRILSLPMYPTIKDEEVDYVIENVKNFVG